MKLMNRDQRRWDAPRPDAPWALITGASRGLGAALAHELAARGWSLVLCGRDRTALDAVAEQVRVLGRRANTADGAAPAGSAADGPRADSSGAVVAGSVAVHVVALDMVALRDRDGGDFHGALVRALSLALSAALSPIAPEQIGLLVNNAGAGALGPFVANDEQAMERAHTLNTVVPRVLTRWLAPAMVARRHGVICNISSVAAFTPGPLMALYYADKAWMLAWGEALDEEVRPHGVRVVTVCPGPFSSDFHRAAHMNVARLGALPSAETVARATVRALRRPRTVVPIGAAARLWAVVGPRLPRALARRIIHAVQRRRA